jgi:hypothetical protein
MGRADFLAPGQHNKICDRTGFKIKSEDSKKEWTNAVVRRKSWEARQPQDLIRSRPDNQVIPDPRTGGKDTFLDEDVDPDDL